MRISIQTKVLVLCIGLVLLTTMSISITYYTLTKQDKHRESQQRIQIAFDIILDDIAEQSQMYTTRFDDFVKRDNELYLGAQMYDQDRTNMKNFLMIRLATVGKMIVVDRLALYGLNKQLLVMHQRAEDQETEKAGEEAEAESAPFKGDILNTTSASLFNEGQKLGIRIAAPIAEGDDIAGVLVGEVWLTQKMVERYASLSKTAINFFAGDQVSLGTLSAQTKLKSEAEGQVIACEDIPAGDQNIKISSLTFDDQAYYQGRCALRNAQGTIGAITVNLSQEIEKQEVRKLVNTVGLISGIVIGVAFGLSVLFSRKAIHAIQNIVKVIIAASEGDLRPTALATTQDEIGQLARKLNQMVTQLRTISGQVQGASHGVNSTADTILQEMETLIHYMEQQSSSVDNTTISIGKIKQFIDVVTRNTGELLLAAAQILSSIQQTRASINEVTSSTDSLAADLHLISSSVDQVNQAVKQILRNTEQLVEIVQQTETEVHHIDQSFRDVSHNADQTKQLAKETMDAALGGQASVDASIQGMNELKTVVSDTAQIIQEVNSWGEQVSLILDIVDEITEQTSLLALNASIISAQAGVHGRGFAVVADEIKELATRTKASTKKIGTLIHALQKKTEDGVQNTTKGITKAEQGMQLANAVKDALTTILDSATRTSTGAEDTVRVIQQTVNSCRIINTSMTRLTEMVSQNRTAIQKEEQDIEQVVAAVENISGMAEQVNRANIEQKRATEDIECSMTEVTEQFSDISDQTEALQRDSDQIVNAMHMIESTTEQILQNATDISNETVKNLIHQSDVLQEIVNVFRIS